MREDESLAGYCFAAWLVLFLIAVSTLLIAVSTLAINARRIADALDRAHPAQEEK